jgi:transcriptional regulator with XRE-family HTH domain
VSTNADQDVGDLRVLVARRLASARAATELSQSTVARQVPGLTRSMVSLLENENRDLSAIEAMFLAEIYQVPVGWLCGEPDALETDLHLNGLDDDELTELTEFVAYLRYRHQHRRRRSRVLSTAGQGPATKQNADLEHPRRAPW